MSFSQLSKAIIQMDSILVCLGIIIVYFDVLRQNMEN